MGIKKIQAFRCTGGIGECINLIGFSGIKYTICDKVVLIYKEVSVFFEHNYYVIDPDTDYSLSKDPMFKQAINIAKIRIQNNDNYLRALEKVKLRLKQNKINFPVNKL